MKSRRDFLKTTAVASVGLAFQSFKTNEENDNQKSSAINK